MTPEVKSAPRGTGSAAPPARRTGWTGVVVPAILIVWLLALLASATLGGWVHLLPLAALAIGARAVVVAVRRRYLTEISRKH